MTNERPTEEDLRNRILNQLSWRGATDTVALIWRGYLVALVEWDLIDVNVHARLLSLLPKIGVKELDELLACEPLSPEREAEIDEYLAQLNSDGLSKSLSSMIMNARGQSENIIVDMRAQPGMTAEIAEMGVSRAFGADKEGKIQSVTIITPTGTLYVPRIP